MEWLAGIFGAVGIKWIAGGAIASVLAWLFKKIPNARLRESMQVIFGKAGFALGVTISLGLAKWKYTAKFWNSIIEPWVIDFIEHVLQASVVYFFDGMVKGMRSDNEK